MKIGFAVRELSEAELLLAKQLGVDGVFCHERMEEGLPGAGDLARLKATVESYGLEILNYALDPGHTAETLKGSPARDREIEGICQVIRAAGKVGIPTVFYNLTHWRSFGKGWSQTVGAPEPGPGDLRLGSGPGRYYRAVGRGGAVLLAHDRSRAGVDAAGAPEAGNAPYGRISADEMWERIKYFSDRVIPVAEEAGVNVGSHPNDPPEKFYRGAEQILNTVEGLKKLVDLVPSPRSGLLLCLGTLHEMGQDTMGAIEYFVKRGKVFSAHFRNPRGTVPGGYYQEDFLDEGDLDMLAVMRLLHKCNYQGSLDPDHAVGIIGDDRRGRIAFSWELGYMKALKAAVEAGL